MSNEHLYRLSYSLEAHVEGIAVEAARERAKDGRGACDAMLAASIIYPSDGSLSILFVSLDGRTGADLDDSEWFKVWAMLSARLAASKTLSASKRDLCGTVHEVISSALRGV